MLYEEWKSRYKNLKNFNTVLQRCPRFWPLAPPRGMNPGVYSLGISEDPPRYLSSKFDASVRSDCWDISIWKTLTQCDRNWNANAGDRGDYNSSPCTSYRRAKKAKLFANSEDPDQTLHSTASELGLHCLPITLLGVSWYNGLSRHCTGPEKTHKCDADLHHHSQQSTYCGLSLSQTPRDQNFQFEITDGCNNRNCNVKNKKQS